MRCGRLAGPRTERGVVLALHKFEQASNFYRHCPGYMSLIARTTHRLPPHDEFKLGRTRPVRAGWLTNVAIVSRQTSRCLITAHSSSRQGTHTFRDTAVAAVIWKCARTLPTTAGSIDGGLKISRTNGIRACAAAPPAARCSQPSLL